LHRSRARVWLVVGAAIAVAGGVAHDVAAKRPRHVTQTLSERGSVDWTRGVVLAVGAAAADLQAPSPTVARIRAERVARQRARAGLAEHARALPYAGADTADTVGLRLDSDEAARGRFQRAVERALDEDVAYGSDGSVVVTLALPVEAVRVAVVGPGAPPTGDGPTAVVVDARGVLMQPAVGVRVGDYGGPVVFHRNGKAAGRDARAGSQIVRVKANAFTDGALAVDGATDWPSAPLLVVLVGK